MRLGPSPRRLARRGDVGNTSIVNLLEGRVVEFGDGPGASVDVRLDCSGVPLLARVPRWSALSLDLRPGRPVRALIKGVSFDRAPIR